MASTIGTACTSSREVRPIRSVRLFTYNSSNKLTEIAKDDNSGDGNNFRINIELPAPLARTATYRGLFVLVHGHVTSVTGSYLLEVRHESRFDPPPDDHGNTVETATVIQNHSSTTGYIHYPRDLDYFRIDLAEAGRLRVEIAGEADIRAELTGVHGTTVVPEYKFFDHDFLVNTDIDAGTYYIRLRGSLTREHYELVVSQLTAPPHTDDHGDGPATATVTGLNNVALGEIEHAGDRDYFVLNLPLRDSILRIGTSWDRY